MSKTSARVKFLRRALRVALCYVLVLQAFLAAFSVSALDRADTAGVAICHNSNDAPLSPDEGTPSLPCTLCATAASAHGLPPGPLAVIAPRTVIGRVQPLGIAVIARPSPARAGLARAPPQFG